MNKEVQHVNPAARLSFKLLAIRQDPGDWGGLFFFQVSIFPFGLKTQVGYNWLVVASTWHGEKRLRERGGRKRRETGLIPTKSSQRLMLRRMGKVRPVSSWGPAGPKQALVLYFLKIEATRQCS